MSTEFWKSQETKSDLIKYRHKCNSCLCSTVFLFCFFNLALISNCRMLPQIHHILLHTTQVVLKIEFGRNTVLSRNYWIFFNGEMLGPKKSDGPQSPHVSLSFSPMVLSRTLFCFLSLPSGSYLNSHCELSWLSHRLPAASFRLYCLIINGWPSGWRPLQHTDIWKTVVSIASEAGDTGMATLQ